VWWCGEAVGRGGEAACRKGGHRVRHDTEEVKGRRRGGGRMQARGR
jgi:hypothetical protein